MKIKIKFDNKLKCLVESNDMPDEIEPLFVAYDSLLSTAEEIKKEAKRKIEIALKGYDTFIEVYARNDEQLKDLKENKRDSEYFFNEIFKMFMEHRKEKEMK